MSSTAPSAWAIEQAMAAWHSLRSRLLTDDPDLAHDEGQLEALLGPTEGDLAALQTRLLRAAAYADQMAQVAEAQLEALTARRDRYRRRYQQCRTALAAIMDAMGQRRFELADGTATWRQSPPAVVVTDEDAIPERFVRIETSRKIDRRALHQALADGEVIDGAALSNGLPSLTLRLR